MRQRLSLSIFLLTFIFLSQKSAEATNTLEVIGNQTPVNDTCLISISMANDSAIVAFQIDIPLSDQLTFIENSGFLNPIRMVDHELDIKIIPGDTLRIIGYSLNNSAFLNDTGTVVSFKLLSGTVPGDYPLNMVNPILGSSSSSNILTSSTNGTETILGSNINITTTSLNFGEIPLLGNAERNFNIANIGNQALNIQNITFDTLFYSVVGSSTFTINPGQSHNVTIRFNAVIKGNYGSQLTVSSNDFDEPLTTIDLSAIAFAVNELHTGNMSVFSGDYSTLDFTINNMEPFVGFQFDVNLPQPMSFVSDSAFLSGRKSNHSISANMIDDNTLRVVAYSENNLWFTGIDGLVLKLGFDIEGVGGYYGINISNVVIGDTNGINSVSAYSGGSLQIAAADIYVSSSIDFGNVSILDSSSESITIYNYGNDTLEISSFQFSDSSFSSAQVFPLNINSGNSYQLDITFNNASEGLVAGTMRIYSNDPDESPKTINLLANTFVPNYIIVNDSMYSYGDTMYVDINVDNLEPFVGFQFDLNYSDSLTCLTNLIQAGQRTVNHTIQANEIDSNTVRLIAYSLSQTEITGSEGTIVSIPFVGDSAVYGQIPMSLDSAILGDIHSGDILWGMNNDSITIARPQRIELQTGWNIFSTNVSPYYMNIDSILAQQMSDGNLIKVIDEEGNFLQNIAGIGWMNTIGFLEVTDGYYIKIDETDTIVCEGNPVTTPITIPLLAGWNIMGYPLINEQDAIQALQPLINNGTLYKIMDEKGGFIQYIEGLGWLNTIGDLKSGEGYYLKVNSNTYLTLNESSSKSKLSLNENIPLDYFSPIQGETIYSPMNFILKLRNDGNNIITMGDEIAIFDGAFCVGASVISENNQEYISIVASMNDDDFEILNGYSTGNEFYFKFWDNETNELYANIIPDDQNNTTVFQPLETYIGSLSTNALGISKSNDDKNGILDIIIAPNPVKNKLKIYYRSVNSGQSEIQIFNLSGNNVFSNSYINQKYGWNTAIVNVNEIKSGFYIGEIIQTTTNETVTEYFKFIKL